MTDQVRVLELKVILGILALQQRAPVRKVSIVSLGLGDNVKSFAVRYVSMRSEERTKYSLIAPQASCAELGMSRNRWTLSRGQRHSRRHPASGDTPMHWLLRRSQCHLDLHPHSADQSRTTHVT